MAEPTFTITAVERETGLSKDVLRVWERRYGFPSPVRDAHGERLYPQEQVDRLRLIRRLMDQGHRPGRLVAVEADKLAGMLAGGSDTPPGPEEEALQRLVDCLRTHDFGRLAQTLQERLVRQGLQHFVLDTVAPLTRMVGEAWEQGRLEVFEEHLFTEQAKRILRQGIATLPLQHRGPRVLLTTVPGEQHVLGLLMVEALFALEGAECVTLGSQMPLQDIARAAVAHQAGVVALSFSGAFPRRQVSGLLVQLRELLPPAILIWVGGRGSAGLGAIPGVQIFSGLEASLAGLIGWQRGSGDK